MSWNSRHWLGDGICQLCTVVFFFSSSRLLSVVSDLISRSFSSRNFNSIQCSYFSQNSTYLDVKMSLQDYWWWIKIDTSKLVSRSFGDVTQYCSYWFVISKLCEKEYWIVSFDERGLYYIEYYDFRVFWSILVIVRTGFQWSLKFY